MRRELCRACGAKAASCEYALPFLFILGFLVVTSATAVTVASQSARSLPELTAPVNDFAHVIDAASAADIERMSRALQAATGDVVVVATVGTIEPFGDIREMAVKLFENHGRGIGERGKDNGLLVLLAVRERRVWVEVGYGLEQWITDGYAGETSREFMVPEFRAGRYGAGLRAGVERLIGRIAEGRNVRLQDVPAPRPVSRPGSNTPVPVWLILLIFVAVLVVSRIGGGRGRRRTFWGGGPWSGWSSGVGPFGGGWGGGGFGGGGGGFGGGFGGFGGGRSGGGGGGGSW
jgi:uncharacterized protein